MLAPKKMRIVEDRESRILRKVPPLLFLCRENENERKSNDGFFNTRKIN